MAVTKADLAEHLFDELGLNKREAKDLIKSFFEEIRTALGAARKSNCPGSGISSYARSRSARGAIPRPVKRSRSAPAAW